MREILFKAKTVEHRKWVEGSLVVLDEEHMYIVPRFENASTLPVSAIIGYSAICVDPETVCQYTGFTDKNGKQIFEGDIVRYNTLDDFDCHSIVKFGEYKQDGSGGEYDPSNCVGWFVEVDNFTCPDWADNDPTYFPDYYTQQNLLEVNHKCEVIGHINDTNVMVKGATHESTRSDQEDSGTHKSP